MKSRFLCTVFSILFLAAMYLPGLPGKARCEVKEGKTAGEKSGEMSAPKETSFKEKKVAYEKAAKEKLAVLEKKIDELEAEAKAAGSRAREDAKKGLAELKQKKEALKNDLRRLRASGRKKWEAVKEKVDAGLDDLEKTYDKVRDYFTTK